MSALNRVGLMAILFYMTLCGNKAYAFWVKNPDEISIYFPAFNGPKDIGLNTSTVLSLKLAQTSRKYPWPNNPKQHDFGDGMLIWGTQSIPDLTYQNLAKSAQQQQVLAQIVVAGQAQYYGNDVVVETVVALPEYKTAPSMVCNKSSGLVCDYRKKNFEIWRIDKDGVSLSVGPPRRYFTLSTMVLTAGVVKQFSSTKGLNIYDKMNNGKLVGRTNEDIRFLEFNRRLPHAPTKVKSNNVEGYISLPELTEKKAEFIDMLGGIWQVFRGDWAAANKSFTRVINIPKTRVPLKVDALLYRGMIKFKQGQDGSADIIAAAKLAPYDQTVLKYRVMAAIELNLDKRSFRRLLKENSILFDKSDIWFQTAIKMF